MTLVRWDPFRELSSVHDRLNRLFGDAYGGRTNDDVMTRGAWMPPVDIYSNGNQELVLKVELPGMDRNDIDLRVENNTLTVHGEKKVDQEVKEDQYHRTERTYGAFSRTFSLPPSVDAGRVSADYKNGVLTVHLPLREEAKPKQIKVEVSA